MEPKMMFKPTKEQYQALQGAFDYFNEALFKDSLPQVMLTLNRERNTFGYYVPSIWTDEKGVVQWGEIALNPGHILKDGERTMIKKIWHKIDGLVYIACLIGLCCLANYIEHL